ncbi:hypothetical protein PspLS_10556 [Pyricularia sp. CBS 133598]|nr:hypothetical protein PspLS_10556 [Pyricularia sp. CBS 133598]
MQLIPILLVGFLAGAQAQTALPTSLPAFTSIWFPGDIPGGPVPSKIEAHVRIDNPGTTTWSFTSKTMVVGATPTSGAPEPYWSDLGLKYASEGRVLTMDYTAGYVVMRPESGSSTWTGTKSGSMTWTGTKYGTFMRVECTSIVSAASAECEGSYGSYKVTLSSVSPGRTTVTGSTIAFQITTPATTQVLTALPVTVTEAPLATGTPTQTPKTTSSSTGGGSPRATQQAGAFAGAAVLVGGAVMLF